MSLVNKLLSFSKLGKQFQGLFADRKNTNFFNGIWRIPVHEIDRPGSFASHMSRSVMLLMHVLKEANESLSLMELCIQLRKTPESEKKYLRDIDREQLSAQAIELCLQSFRQRIKKISKSTYPGDAERNESIMLVMLDIYSSCQTIKNIPDYKNTVLPKIQVLLEDAYKLGLNHHQPVMRNLFEMAKECCRQFKRCQKNPATAQSTGASSPSSVASASPSAIPLTNNFPLNPNVNYNKPKKPTVPGRPRGRPPMFEKNFLSPNASDKTSIYESVQLPDTPSDYINNLIMKESKTTVRENALTDILSHSPANLNNSDLSTFYLSQLEAYQDALRHYQSHITLSSDIGKVIYIF